MVRSRYITLTCMIIISCMVICMITENIRENQSSTGFDDFSVTSERFRAMDLSDIDLDYVYRMADEWGIDRFGLLAMLVIYDYPFNENDSMSKNQAVKKCNYLIRGHGILYNSICNALNTVLADICYFPVPYSYNGEYWINYVDSWGFERTYGGKRQHEGTDLMADRNESGLYPVISITSGIVENKGWLEKGGWRIGIRSDNGGYYYYAHLSDYADIEPGDRVEAGEIIGFMGNTGYGVKEGTSGVFDVHLHMGIYMDYMGEEISINPYWILKHLEKNVLIYKY